MSGLATVQGTGVLNWLKRPRYSEDERAAAETGELRTCYLRGGPLDGDELKAESCPAKLSIEKHYTVAAPRVEAYEGVPTRRHHYRMVGPCSGGFIYVYDGSR